MTSGTSQGLTWLEGEARRVDQSGLTLHSSGRAARRYSISRYADPRPPTPDEGQRVRVGLDRQGYIRAIEPLDAPPLEDEATPARVTPLRPPPAAPEQESLEQAPLDEDWEPPFAVEPPALEPPARRPPSTQRGAEPPRPQPRPHRDVVVTRLACLNTAVSILTSGGRAADPDAVLAMAEQLERWATRAQE